MNRSFEEKLNENKEEIKSKEIAFFVEIAFKKLFKLFTFLAFFSFLLLHFNEFLSFVRSVLLSIHQYF